MGLANTTTGYGWAAIALHWISAIAIAGLLVLGLVMTEVEDTRGAIALYQWHKSLGLTVLALVVLRLGWRLANPHPRMPATMRAYERGLAGAAHYGLYGLMLAMPISGWVMASASSFPTEYFGWFDVPRLVAVGRAMEERAEDLHETLSWALIALIAVHVAAALKHHLVDRDDVLRRMLRPSRAA